MTDTLFMVTPPNIRTVNGVYEIDKDFSNNLRLYLANFSHVTLACSVLSNDKNSGIPSSFPLSEIKNSNKFSFIPLPSAYREDRYLRHYIAMRKLLHSQISKAKYLLFSPHAMYDWSSLATLLAIKMKRKYGFESDYDHVNMTRFKLSTMAPGLNKIRKTIWGHSFLNLIEKAASNSSVALLQGKDVFEAYKNVAPNAYQVLNVQVSAEDYISPAQLEEKLAHIKAGGPLIISYAGRMVEMKGPLDWLKVIHAAVEARIDLRAKWFGDGPLMPQMRSELERLGIHDKVTLAGFVDRGEIKASLRKTDIFLFCHKTGESPRCLVEALAAGCSLVGYSTAYPRDLVATHGGGEFTDMGDWRALAKVIVSLDRNREGLVQLIEAASASGRLLDRDAAIQNRIELIKKHLGE